MAEYLIQDATVKYIAGAVREKAGITNEMSPQRIAAEIYLLNADTDTGAPSKGVTFYDYDGTVLYHYTVKEARALKSLPSFPNDVSHDGLTFSGWTHSLDDVNSVMKCLDVGAMYDSPSSKLVLEIPSAQKIALYINQTVSNGVLIQWGDGTSSTISGTGDVGTEKYYQSAGTYTVELTITSGDLSFGCAEKYLLQKYVGAASQDNKETNLLKHLVVGGGAKIRATSGNPFVACYNLETAVLCSGLSSLGEKTFYECESLKFCVIPNTVTTIRNQSFYMCSALINVIIPESVTSILDYAFTYCDNSAFTSIIVPANASVGRWSFYQCKGLKECYIRNSIPSTKCSDVFGGYMNNALKIYVPATSVDTYKTAQYWSNYASKIKGEPIPIKF